MEGKDQILSLLKEEKEMMLQIEKVTEEMAAAPMEQLPEKMKARTYYFTQMQQIHEEIDALCGQEQELVAAVKLTGVREDLPEEYQPIFDAAYAVQGVANRILQNGNLTRERLEREKGKLMEKIKDLNQSGSSVAQHYRKTVEAGNPDKWSRLGKNV